MPGRFIIIFFFLQGPVGLSVLFIFFDIIQLLAIHPSQVVESCDSTRFQLSHFVEG